MKNYKRMIAIFICIIFVIGLTACQPHVPAAVLPDASPDSIPDEISAEVSNVALYYYDGKIVSYQYLLDAGQIKDLTDQLSDVKAVKSPNWGSLDIRLPFYGLSIGRDNADTIFAAWSNGYLITQDGSAYHFDYDFAALAQNEKWIHPEIALSFADFPCARFFAEGTEGWRQIWLGPASDLIPSDDITMTVDQYNQQSVAVSITNKSGEDWTYGEFFSMQVLLEDKWYQVPPMPGDWAFFTIAYCVQNGETQNRNYDISMYGELPVGTYRIVIEQVTAEMTVQ